MSDEPGVLLVQACESLCERLYQSVGLTTFRIELRRDAMPLVVSLRKVAELVPDDPRHAWMLPPTPARLDVPVRHNGRLVAEVRIEDRRRAGYPPSAAATCEKLASEFAPLIEHLLTARAV
jgi:hypothetical protein